MCFSLRDFARLCIFMFLCVCLRVNRTLPGPPGLQEGEQISELSSESGSKPGRRCSGSPCAEEEEEEEGYSPVSSSPSDGQTHQFDLLLFALRGFSLQQLLLQLLLRLLPLLTQSFLLPPAGHVMNKQLCRQIL